MGTDPLLQQNMAFFFKWQGGDDNKEGWKIFKKHNPDKSHNMTSIGSIIFTPAHDLNKSTLLCWGERMWPEHYARIVFSS